MLSIPSHGGSPDHSDMLQLSYVNSFAEECRMIPNEAEVYVILLFTGTVDLDSPL